MIQYYYYIITLYTIYYMNILYTLENKKLQSPETYLFHIPINKL